MEKRFKPQRRHDARREEDEVKAKALNDLLEAVRSEADASIDWRTSQNLRKALAEFAMTQVITTDRRG